MKSIFNFLLRTLVLWVGMTLFSSYIQIDSYQTLLIAALLVSVIQIIYGILMLIFAATSVIVIGIIPFIISILLCPFIGIIELWLLNNYLPGFTIHGALTYILLAVALSIFSISDKSKSTN